MSEEIKLTIEVLTFLGGLIGLYFKMKYDISKTTDKVDDLKVRFDEHEEITPLCNKRFEDLTLDVKQLKTTEQYQSQIVEKILQPILKNIVDSMKEYTDLKIQIITNEIKVYQEDNKEFKADIKNIMKDFKDENQNYMKQLKDENNSAIERLVTVVSQLKK